MRRLLFFFSCALGVSGQVQYGDILHSPSQNWLTYHGDYRAHRYSPLTQINRGNVAGLVPKWTYQVNGAHRFDSTPIVYEGVMYVTSSNEVDALDAQSGKPIWIFREENATQDSVNRGVAILGNTIFFVTADAHLVALQRSTGGILW